MQGKHLWEVEYEYEGKHGTVNVLAFGAHNAIESAILANSLCKPNGILSVKNTKIYVYFAHHE